MTNNITIDNRVINKGPTFVYKSPGREDLSPLTDDAIYEVLASDATANGVMARCFAMVCCNRRLRKNHVYHIPNLKDAGVVMVRRRNGKWGRAFPAEAFAPTASNLSDHLLKHQPTYRETADITGPKLNEVRKYTGVRVVPSALARLFMQQLRLRAHGELSPEELRSTKPRSPPTPEPKPEEDPFEFDAIAEDFFD